MKPKKEKKITKASQKKDISKLKRKLLKLWSEKVRERDGNKCLYCGIKNGEASKSNPETITRINAHHLLQKEIKDCPLKFEIINGIAVCPSCHKYNGEHSCHKSPIVFYNWFRLNYPESYDFILKNSHIRICLDNIMVLQEIESKLMEGKSLDLDLLKKMDDEYLLTKTTTTTSTTTEATFSV